jgi:hypothetical protein
VAVPTSIRSYPWHSAATVLRYPRIGPRDPASALYPLFDDDLIRLMREMVPHDKQDSVAISVALKAKLPNVGSLN